ncbi:MAG: prolyl oligopeptidase family serine peptidase [Puniceicoccales bacterium]|jgi:prolyl oligopeptidase|nr:prolyl oligopeptidase family serine peptidase [Puniceicoccales bacterium]
MKSSIPLLFASAMLAFPLGAWAITPPPETRRDNTVEIMHGEKIADPYRWLEGSDAPELKGKDAALDAQVRAWSEAQNKRTRAYLNSIPGRDVLEKELRELFKTDSLSSPAVRGGKHFYSRRRGNESNSVLFVRDGKDGAERELLNVNKLYPDGRTTLDWTRISREGKLVGFATYKSGDENSTLRILDVETGKWLKDTIPGKVRSMSWLPGGEAFIYRCLGDIDNPYSGQIKYHKLGDDIAKDKLIFEQYKTGPLATTYGPSAGLDREGKWMVLSYSTGTASNDLWVCDFQHWLKTSELKKITIAEGKDATFSAIIRGDTMYLESSLNVPQGQLYKVDLNNPDPANWKELLRGSEDSVFEGASLSKDFMIVNWKENALRRIELRDLDGKRIEDITLPGIGSAGLSTDQEHNDAYLGFSSFNVPPSTYHIDLKTRERTLYFRPDYDVDSDSLVVRQEFFTSKDGTRVPLFIAHRKDLKLDSTAPTILYGYGGFNIAQRPGFNSSLIPWLNAGGVYALAGLRGGSEFGEPWHRAGMLEKKQNVFDDFIGAAEFLIEKKYTSPAHLGIRGGSNGGLLTGAALVQRPDLFGAVIVGVPLLDMLRYQHFLMARYWIPEYGDPAKKGDFQWIKAYSPYHHVKKGVKYPATLIEAGENDARVHPLHAKKMAARLQHDTAGDPEKQPILLWVDFDSGHGMGKSFDMRVRDTADVYLFFAKQLGLSFGK